MEWPARGEDSLNLENPLLFDPEYLPTSGRFSGPEFKSLTVPVWTQNKAFLIKEYIRLFTYVTRHGAYIDGFAAPQRRNGLEICSAKLVLENEPVWIRKLWLCDVDRKGVALLNTIKTHHEIKGRRVEVISGDFNVSIDRILTVSNITEATATFALLDQRTFECDWATVVKIANHKKIKTKIEIFYFFGAGWLDRSLAASKTLAGQSRVRAWWGQDNWRILRGMDGIKRAELVTERFRSELGYRHARAYPIHDKNIGSRVMYYMIHATDHDAAPPLMLRAYRKVAGRRNFAASTSSAIQTDFEALWGQ